MGNGHKSIQKMGTGGRWGYCQARCIWNRAKYFLAGTSPMVTFFSKYLFLEKEIYFGEIARDLMHHGNI